MPLRGSRRVCAQLTLTSGSTGLPKAAVHTYQAHLASAEGVLSLIPFGDHDDWLLSFTAVSRLRSGNYVALVIRWCADDGA